MKFSSRLLTLTAGLVLSVSALATMQPKSVQASAVLNICPVVKKMEGHKVRLIKPLGCLDKILVNKKEAVVTAANDDTRSALNNIIGTYQFHGMTKSSPIGVEGYFSKKRIMGYERPVFVVEKIDKSSIILPK